MEFIYFIIFFIALIISEMDCAIMKEMSMKVFQTEVIHSSDDEGSLLQCAHKCRLIDKNSVIDFKDSRCRCIRYSTKEQSNELTLSGIFVNQRILKYVKPPEKLYNAALFKPTQQSSTQGGAARNGNDGKMKTSTSTRHTRWQWWQLDLEKDLIIGYIIIYAVAGSGSYNRDLAIKTKADGKTYQTCKYIGRLTNKRYNFTCEKPTTARYIKVTADRCRVSIYEFEVYSPVLD